MRLVAQPLDQPRVHFVFQILRRGAGQHFVLAAIELDHKVLGLDRRIAGEHFEHFDRVAHADVERIDLERLLERLLRRDFVGQAHLDQAQLPVRRDELRHPLDRLAVKPLGGRIPAQPVEAVAEGVVELAGVRVSLVDFVDQFAKGSLFDLFRCSVSPDQCRRQPPQRLLRPRVQLVRFLQDLDRPCGSNDARCMSASSCLAHSRFGLISTARARCRFACSSS